jgi:hypothetical protein
MMRSVVGLAAYMELKLGYHPVGRRPEPMRRKNAKGAPACAGVPWGLAFETWDPGNQSLMDTRDITKG